MNLWLWWFAHVKKKKIPSSAFFARGLDDFKAWPPLPVFLEDAARASLCIGRVTKNVQMTEAFSFISKSAEGALTSPLSETYILIQIWIDRNLLCVCWVSLSLSLSLFNKWVCLRVSTRRASVDRQLRSPFYLPGETRNSRANPTQCSERSTLFFILRPLEWLDDTGQERWVQLPAKTHGSVLSAQLRNIVNCYYGLFSLVVSANTCCGGPVPNVAHTWK